MLPNRLVAGPCRLAPPAKLPRDLVGQCDIEAHIANLLRLGGRGKFVYETMNELRSGTIDRRYETCD